MIRGISEDDDVDVDVDVDVDADTNTDGGVDVDDGVVVVVRTFCGSLTTYVCTPVAVAIVNRFADVDVRNVVVDADDGS